MSLVEPVVFLKPAIFYMFATITIFSAFMVVLARNPVHAVLFLILAFFNVAGLFVLQGAEFLAMLLIIVYVGAIAVLFLFVVMMLDVGRLRHKKRTGYLPVALLVAGLFLTELIITIGGHYWQQTGVGSTVGSALTKTPSLTNETNIEAIGRVLYTDFSYLFQLSGMILLVAMIGAIVLTHRRRKGVRRQNINKQVSVTRKDGVRVVKVEPKQGV